MLPGSSGHPLPRFPELKSYRSIHISSAFTASYSSGRAPCAFVTKAAASGCVDRVARTAAGCRMRVPEPVDPGELTTIIASVTMRPPFPGVL